MTNELLGEWAPFIFPAVAFFYLLILRGVDRKVSGKRLLSVEEHLVKMARMSDSNEHDIFFQSAEKWNVGKFQVEKDFKTYLLQGDIPYYVNDFVRKDQKKSNEEHRPPFLLGGGYLPWLK